MNSFKKFLFAVAILGLGYTASASASSLGTPAANHTAIAHSKKGDDKKGHHHGHKGHHGKGGAKKSGK